MKQRKNIYCLQGIYNQIMVRFIFSYVHCGNELRKNKLFLLILNNIYAKTMSVNNK
jgi:hypothetical protein